MIKVTMADQHRAPRRPGAPGMHGQLVAGRFEIAKAMFQIR